MTRRQPVGPAAARYRNDPQVRAMVADNAQPAPVLTAPPVTAPPVAPRQAQGRPAPRPPFEGRAPGGFAGRPDGARPDAARPDGGGGRGEQRAPKADPNFGRSGDALAGARRGRAAGRDASRRNAGDRTASASRDHAACGRAARPSRRKLLAPPRVVAPPVAGGAARDPPATAGPPVGARGVRHRRLERPADFSRRPAQRRESMRRAAPNVAPPSPVQRSAAADRGEPVRAASRVERCEPRSTAPPARAEALARRIRGRCTAAAVAKRPRARSRWERSRREHCRSAYFTPRPVDAPRATEAQRPAPGSRGARTRLSPDARPAAVAAPRRRATGRCPARARGASARSPARRLARAR